MTESPCVFKHTWAQDHTASSRYLFYTV